MEKRGVKGVGGKEGRVEEGGRTRRGKRVRDSLSDASLYRTFPCLLHVCPMPACLTPDISVCP